MRIAQQLYEGVNIKGQGTVGLITYLRTDSTRISVEADAAAKEYIKEAYGAEFVGAGTVAKKDDKKVQDAHAVSYTHLRAHETDSYLVCRLLLEKKKITQKHLRAHAR